MRASELIAALQVLVDAHDDPVVYAPGQMDVCGCCQTDPVPITPPEYGNVTGDAMGWLL